MRPSSPDTTPPVLTLPRDMTVAATSAAGANVPYDARARDAVDGEVATSCWPRNGDRFFVGETTVRCSARDSAGNVARGSFDVTVTPFAPAPAAGAVVLSEDFEGGLSRWAESGEPDWRTGTHEWFYNPDGTRTSGTSNDVAKADNCDTGCTFTLARPVNLSGYTGATLTLSRFVDRSLDSGEYLRVQAHKGGSWATIWSWTHGSGDDGAWHHESYGLSSYLVSDFKLRLVARMSSSSEDVGVDNVEVRATGGTTRADTTRPVVTAPPDMSLTATSPSGAMVTYTPVPTAVDNVDGRIKPVCTPASGSTFAVGTTTVTCEATDNAGNKGSDTFTVTVRALDTTRPTVTAPPSVTHSATSPAGAVVEYADATAVDNVDGRIAATCTPASGSTFAVGATTVTCEATDRAGNKGSDTFTVTVSPFVDTVAPVVSALEVAPVTASSTAGTAVTYGIPRVTDNVDASLTPTCTPASGSTFAVGATTVTCESTDSAGNTGSATFPVTVNFEEGFGSGLAGWTVAGGGWASEASENGNPPGSASGNKVAEADDCDTECTMTLGPIDLSGYATATLEFWRYVDPAIDSGEHLTVLARAGGNTWDRIYEWTERSDMRGTWRMESYSLANHLESGFMLRFAALADGADEEVAIDGVSIRGSAGAPADSTRPVILGPDAISVTARTATSTTHNVAFVVTASDNVDGSIVPTCTWTRQGVAAVSGNTGGTFDVGTTTVTCTAVDSSGTSALPHTITVTVSAPAPGLSTVPATLPLRGGMSLHAHFDPLDGVTPGITHDTGTVGFVVNHTGDRPAILLSSHIADIPRAPNHRLSEVLLYQSPPPRHQANAVEMHAAFHANHPVIGTVLLSSTNAGSGRTVSADAALVLANGTGVTPHINQVQNGTSIITVTKFGGVAGMEGKLASIVGLFTKSSGEILHDGVTVRFRAGDGTVTVVDQATALYRAEGGDSGAPVLHRESDGAYVLLGLHVGRVTMATIDSSGRVLHADPLANPVNIQPQFSILSPWENIQRDLGIPN